MSHLSDIKISQSTKLSDIRSIASKLNLTEDDLELYGKYKAKINVSEKTLTQLPNKSGKLILVTAINPTPAGEGKTTVSIGLADSLAVIGHSTVVALREPSLGPCFGIKGGATGGGYAQVAPMEDINLHFTGDLHAVTAAHNLIAALLDNHLYHGNQLQLDPNQISWKRVIDMNDRALRHIVLGLGGRANGVVRESGFDITVASEIMAVLCLATDLADLRVRIGAITLGYSHNQQRITLDDLNAVGAVMALLKDAIKPNLIQTLEGTPCLMHGGPFANIAHGCNSVIATQLGLKLADFVVTEAGFGADLGAEKFIDIKCRVAQLQPDAVVLVATLRSLKMNGGVSKSDLAHENLAAVNRGLANLGKHLENLQLLGQKCLVALNWFVSDHKSELELVQNYCRQFNVAVITTTVWEHGSAGGKELAEEVLKLTQQPASIKFLYDSTLPLKEKIRKLAEDFYGAAEVKYTSYAQKKLDSLCKQGFDDLLVCVAKTQYSLSDDPKLLARPNNFSFTVRDLRLASGAGFVVVIAGEIMTMPGLPKTAAAEFIDVDEFGQISGLF